MLVSYGLCEADVLVCLDTGSYLGARGRTPATFGEGGLCLP